MHRIIWKEIYFSYLCLDFKIFDMHNQHYVQWTVLTRVPYHLYQCIQTACTSEKLTSFVWMQESCMWFRMTILGEKTLFKIIIANRNCDLSSYTVHSFFNCKTVLVWRHVASLKKWMKCKVGTHHLFKCLLLCLPRPNIWSWSNEYIFFWVVMEVHVIQFGKKESKMA